MLPENNDEKRAAGQVNPPGGVASPHAGAVNPVAGPPPGLFNPPGGRPAGFVNPLPQSPKTISGVSASHVKTPGVGGYIKMMYFNPNHGLAAPQGQPAPMPVPQPTPPTHPNAPMGGVAGLYNFVMGQPNQQQSHPTPPKNIIPGGLPPPLPPPK